MLSSWFIAGAALVACSPPPPAARTPAHPASAAKAPEPHVVWQEHFDHPPLDWVDPFDHGAAQIAREFSVQHEGAWYFLRARHDATVADPVPPIDYGRAFQHDAVALEKIRALRWRWRALRQPPVTDDPWLDMAASVYVVVKTPSLLFGGRGFKFGWLSKPGPAGTHQHGLLQIAQRTDPPGPEWKSESVDLCALYRKEYGPCEGQHLLYVGVVTDADNTHSIAEGDYADFELSAVP